MADVTKLCSRCHVNLRLPKRYHCRDCRRILDKESRDRKRAQRQAEHPEKFIPANEKPCARCGVNPRQSKSYCKDCVRLSNQEAAERRKQRLLVEDPHRFDPANTKPCNRCGEAPRDPGCSSYCRPCQRLFDKESRERKKARGYKPPRYPSQKIVRPDKPCARCKVAEREVMSYCRPCHRVLAQESRIRISGKKPQDFCSRCGEVRYGAHLSYCSECWREKQLERWHEVCAACGKERDPEDRTSRAYCYDCYRNNWLQRNYGITLADFNELLEWQDNKCALCLKEANGRVWHLDHDHETGVIRGVLCDKCNRGLGHFNDDRDTLLRAAAYVLAFQNPCGPIWQERHYPLRVVTRNKNKDLPIPA